MLEGRGLLRNPLGQQQHNLQQHYEREQPNEGTEGKITQ